MNALKQAGKSAVDFLKSPPRLYMARSISAGPQTFDEEDNDFTKEEVALFRRLFEKYDRDDNCKLDRWEFNNFARFVVGRSFNMPDLEKVMKRADMNKDGFLTWEELMTHLSRRFDVQDKDRVTVAFNIFDKDGDGRLQFWEAKQAILYLGENIVLKRMRHHFDSVDKDQDGMLTYKEFLYFLCKYVRGGGGY